METASIVLKLLVEERHMAGIVVCIDRSPLVYQKLMQENGISSKDIFFLDVTGSGEKMPAICKSESISDLTTLSIDLFKLVNAVNVAVPGQRVFVYMDSATSLQWYSGQETVGRFLHATNLRLRAAKAYQVYVIDPGSAIGPEIRKFCDNIVEIKSTAHDEFAAALGADT